MNTIGAALDQGQATPEMSLSELLPLLAGDGARTGQVRAVRDEDPRFEVWLDRGRLVAANWGRLHGLSALEMGAVFIPRAQFAFLAGRHSPVRHFDLSPLDLSVRLAQVGREGAELRPTVPGPFAVPSVVPARRVPNDPEAVRLLSRIDGQRSVAELAEGRQPLVVVRGLAYLAREGAIAFEPRTPAPAETAPPEAPPVVAAPAETPPPEPQPVVETPLPEEVAPVVAAPAEMARPEAAAVPVVPVAPGPEASPTGEPQSRRGRVPVAVAAAVLVIIAIVGTVRAFPPSPVTTVQTQPTATAQAAAVAAPALPPTEVPTPVSTGVPTVAPTIPPAVAPTAVPAVAPAAAPTLGATAAPTVAPTAVPTLAPTVAPTLAPTIAPTAIPTAAPTLAPTIAPTTIPTTAPTLAPTNVPTVAPTAVPTVAPTDVPTLAATSAPAVQATAVPALAPTGAPTAAPLPLIDETFATGPAGWPSSVTSSAYWDSSGYHLEPRVAGQYVAIAAPLGASLGNVSVTGLFRKTAGPAGGGYGVIVRAQGGPYDGNNQGGRFYVFEVGDKGEVGAWRREGTQWIDLLGWTPSPAVQPGNAENRIDVQADGSQFSFSVNGTQVAQISDPTLSSGAVGVFTGGDGNQVLLERFEASGL